MVHYPVGGNGHVPRRHSGGDLPIPPREGVARSGGVRRSGNGGAIVLRDGRDLAAAIGIKGDGVPVCRPPGGDGHIPCRHGSGDLPIPPCKGVTRFGGVFRCGNGGAVVLCDGCDLAAAGGIKGNGVPVRRPFCRQGQGFGHGIGKVPFFFALVPAGKGMALFGGVGRSGGRGVGTNLGWSDIFAI